MNTQKTTQIRDWSFFEKVARAAFANPFGRKRDELDMEIGGTTPGASADAILNAVIARISARVFEMRRAGIVNLGNFDGDRREIMHSVLLFHVFHRYADRFDKLIQAQSKDDETLTRVSFGEEALKELTELGFSEPESLRFFAIFYQLRRAYYFIKNGLTGNSASVIELRKNLWDCLFTHDIRWYESRLWNRMEDFSILLLGETGTGKGAAAAAIGRSGFIPYDPARQRFSASFTRNFLATNLSQFSEGVLESELFGHKKGAFTGAIETHDGLFSRCAPNGVIFLDEIGDISIPVQIKLLNVLQERIYSPVGSHETKRFSGRVIAATNRPLDELRSSGRFRDDLYYRLCSNIITLPTLRQRLQETPEELDRLLENILTRLAGEPTEREVLLIKKVLKRETGTAYHWPGNVRELEQSVKRIILTGHYQGSKFTIKPVETGDSLTSDFNDGNINAEQLLAGYCSLLYKRHGTYEEVSRRTQLDRRTVKKYVQLGEG
jgi:two-component system, NtrC family, response regulator HydG